MGRDVSAIPAVASTVPPLPLYPCGGLGEPTDAQGRSKIGLHLELAGALSAGVLALSGLIAQAKGRSRTAQTLLVMSILSGTVVGGLGALRAWEAGRL